MTADEWNALPSGTAVKLFPKGRGKDIDGKERPWMSCRKKGQVYYLSSGKAYALIDGQGGKPVANVDVLEQPKTDYGYCG